jgi:hypothetical protein
MSGLTGFTLYGIVTYWEIMHSRGCDLVTETAGEQGSDRLGGHTAERVAISTDDGVSLIVAEYESLRSEILKLIELQAQLVALTVIAFGGVLSVGFQAKKAVIVLIYPILSLILGLSWLNHAHAICRCAEYIRQRIEDRFVIAQRIEDRSVKFMGWESFVSGRRLPKAIIGYWGVRSIFMGSSALAIVAGTVIPKRGTAVWTFYYLAIGVTALTILVFVIWREPYLPKPGRGSGSASIAKGTEEGALPTGDRSIGEQEHSR